jgi:hypothetical protein
MRLCLERRDLFELRSGTAQKLIKVVGEDTPFTLRVVRIAAGLSGSDAVETARIRHRKRFQHHGIKQREDRGGGADTEP